MSRKGWLVYVQSVWYIHDLYFTPDENEAMRYFLTIDNVFRSMKLVNWGDDDD